MLQELDAHFSRSVHDVFNTMLDYKLETTSAEGWSMNGQPHLAGCVGFFGTLTGVVYLYASEVFARRLASRLLGMSDAELEGDELINDAMGEIANMVVGPIKSRLSDSGMACVLTIPSIVRGTSFSVEPCSSTQRRTYAFQCLDGVLFVEVLIKSGTSGTN